MKISNYIYGSAANNMHGNLQDAVAAGAISQVEADAYQGQASCIMSGRSMKGEFRTSIQIKLDAFFKRDIIDYQDFNDLCRKLSGDRWVTVCCPDIFINYEGRHYFGDDGKAVEVSFTSRFDK